GGLLRVLRVPVLFARRAPARGTFRAFVRDAGELNVPFWARLREEQTKAMAVTETGSFEETVKYNEAGLVPVVVQDAQNGEVLMVAYMNAEALRRTRESGRATYWSRSRQQFWVKGESSGNVQHVRDLR